MMRKFVLENLKVILCVFVFVLYFVLVAKYMLHNRAGLPLQPLLLNGDFAEGITYWRTFHWFGDYEILDDIRYIGQSLRSLRIAIPTKFGGKDGHLPTSRTAGVFQFTEISSDAQHLILDPSAASDPRFSQDSMFLKTFTLEASVKLISVSNEGSFQLMLRGMLKDGRHFEESVEKLDRTHMVMDPLTLQAAWQKVCLQWSTTEDVAYLAVYLLLIGAEGSSAVVRQVGLSVTASELGNDPDHRHLKAAEAMAPRDGGEKAAAAAREAEREARNDNSNDGADGLCAMYDAAVVEEEQYIVHPFFARASLPSTGDITLGTQLTPDRLEALTDMYRMWEGPMSVALYVSDLRDLLRLEEMRAANPGMAQHVDVHVVYSDVLSHGKQSSLYPINFLRNVAIKQVVTRFVLMLDVDFLPSPGLRALLPPYLSSASENSGFVLPAFEIDGFRYPLQMPRTKQALIRLIDGGAARPIHATLAAESQRATNYERWVQSDHPYLAVYENHYEPFFVVSTAKASYDPRFKGYGFDKASHAYALSREQFEFFVLPSSFIVHRDHGVPVWRNQMPYITLVIWSNVYEYLYEVELRIHDTLSFAQLWEMQFNWLDLSQWSDIEAWNHMRPPSDVFKWSPLKLFFLGLFLLILWRPTLREIVSLLQARYHLYLQSKHDLQKSV